jgi:hypothetical protein
MTLDERALPNASIANDEHLELVEVCHVFGALHPYFFAFSFF